MVVPFGAESLSLVAYTEEVLDGEQVYIPSGGLILGLRSVSTGDYQLQIPVGDGVGPSVHIEVLSSFPSPRRILNLQSALNDLDSYRDGYLPSYLVNKSPVAQGIRLPVWLPPEGSGAILPFKYLFDVVVQEPMTTAFLDHLTFVAGARLGWSAGETMRVADGDASSRSALRLIWKTITVPNNTKYVSDRYVTGDGKTINADVFGRLALQCNGDCEDDTAYQMRLFQQFVRNEESVLHNLVKNKVAIALAGGVTSAQVGNGVRGHDDPSREAGHVWMVVTNDDMDMRSAIVLEGTGIANPFQRLDADDIDYLHAVSAVRHKLGFKTHGCKFEANMLGPDGRSLFYRRPLEAVVVSRKHKLSHYHVVSTSGNVRGVTWELFLQNQFTLVQNPHDFDPAVEAHAQQHLARLVKEPSPKGPFATPEVTPRPTNSIMVTAIRSMDLHDTPPPPHSFRTVDHITDDWIVERFGIEAQTSG